MFLEASTLERASWKQANPLGYEDSLRRDEVHCRSDE